MQKSEFEKMIGHSVSDADYEVIEMVYQWHPVVKETSGKDEVAELWKSFGITIFLDMFPRAKKACELQKKLCHAQSEVESIKKEIKELLYLPIE